MSWDKFEEAFALSRFTVLGKKLRPFCAYHQFWLEVLQNPCWRGQGGRATVIDLELAALVCSSGFGEVEQKLAARSAPGFWRRLWWRLLGQWRWLARVLFGDFPREAATFAAYLKSGFAPPEFYGAGGEVEKFPQLLDTVCLVAANTGWSEKKIWTLPLGRLHWYAAGFLRLQGVELKIITSGDHAWRAFKDKIIAAAEEKLGRKLTKEECRKAFFDWFKNETKN